MSKRGANLVRAIIGTLVLLALVVADLSVMTATQPQRAEAVTGSQFQAGYIISDGNFFDGNSMSPMDVQYFLNSKVSSCRAGYTCLKDYLQTVPNMPAESGLCNGYSAGYQSAAEIISRVGQSCGVSPKTLLVLLQKEQSLVTDTWPVTRQYNSATGFSCPDTAPCDSAYAGFFYQVYYGARQLRNYGRIPTNWNYRAGQTTNILYNPNRDCGSSPVYIQNRATAALYNYTPYQPNSAALNNLYGVGDACSAYGNRNFWRLWTDWFGPTTAPPGTPEGDVTITGQAGGIAVRGWAVDPDSTTAAVGVAFQVNTTWRGLSANQNGADLSSSYAGAGANHYFNTTYPFPPGNYGVCTYLVNAGGSGSQGSLGCKTVTVTSPPDAQGAITGVQVSPGKVILTGWAVRPDDPTGPVNVAANVGSSWVQATSGIANSDAATAVAGAGPNQGFTTTISLPTGQHNVCIWVSKSVSGANQIGCRAVVIPAPAMTKAAIDSLTVSGNNVTMTGWAVYPDALTTPVHLAINVGSRWWPVTADQTNPNANTAVPGAGNQHGFNTTVALPSGIQDVCLWTTHQAASPTLVSCRQAAVAVAPATNQGQIETVIGGVNSITYSGWATWLGQDSATVRVAANIGSQWYPIDANQPSTAAQSAGAGVGPNHGFTGSLPIGPGNYNVCFWMSKAEGGASFMGCRNVTVNSGRATVGQVQTVTSGAGGIHVDGWAVMPDNPSGSIRLAANIGNRWIPFDTGLANSAAGGSVAGAGPNQGFSALIPADPGPQSFCIWATGMTGPVLISCHTVVVNPSPEILGRVSEFTGVPGGVRVTGWVVWPSSPTVSVNVASEINNIWTATPTASANNDAIAWVAGAGPNQGFTGIIPSSSGNKNICVWASKPSGGAALLECRAVVVP